MSRRSTNPTLAEAVAYCVTEAVSRFTEYITPVTAKIVKRPGPKATEIIPHETLPEALKQQVKEYEEEKSTYDSHAKKVRPKKKQLKEETKQMREKVRTKVHETP